MEKKSCLANDCTEVKIEPTTAYTEKAKENAEILNHATVEVSPSGYFSSGGLLKVTNPKTGKREIHYGSPYIE